MYDDSLFEWKNMFLSKNDSNDIAADIKYVIISDGRTYTDGTPYGDFNLPDLNNVPAGTIYGKRKVMPFNRADLNHDGKVNLPDYAIFADNWGRTGIVKGSDVNDLGAYADMSDEHDPNGVMTSYGNGSVDNNDLAIFQSEYLWDANDPNTW